jgi:catechol 2,3-dioxygenase-like lactoylglutathione lyase family enzyme
MTRGGRSERVPPREQEGPMSEGRAGARALRVDCIDHVELLVPGRREAAGWYERVLGLSVVPEHEHFAADPRGPLMISSDGGDTMLALFRGEPQREPPRGWRLVAFRVDAAGFAAFVDLLDREEIRDHQGRRVDRRLVSDHGSCWSLYFCDPWGTRLELTTYDYDAAAERLRRAG